MDKAYANSKFSGTFDPQASLNQLDGVNATMTRAEAMATNTDWGDVISRTGMFNEVIYLQPRGVIRVVHTCHCVTGKIKVS